jgi:Zn-dependent membrane protease YugP
LINLGIFIYLVLTVFQLITLPVEFDASVRAKKQLVGLGIIEQDEIKGVNETLDAAAFTYVAAFISSLGWLLYMLAQRR